MKSVIKRIIVKLNIINILSIWMYFFRIFKIKSNKIVCVNFSGKGFGDSPKYIVNELLKDEKKYDIVWVTKNLSDIDFPKNVRVVKIYSLKYFFELTTAKIWINNSRFPQFIRKRKGQFYIQTWHSPLRFKKIEMDAIENLSEYYKKVMKNDSKMIDLMISGCDFSYNIYNRAFLYDGKIEKCGTPRCDLFFDVEKCNEIKKDIYIKFNLDSNKKNILYAPTYRKNSNFEESIVDLNMLVNKLGDKYNILVRLHPSSNFKLQENSKIIDVTKYSDIQELICASDILITDYSSCMFDMLIANKICTLFLKDMDEYITNERGVYFKLTDLPFEQFKNEKDLINYIEAENFDEYYIKVNRFKEKIGLYENGNASKTISKIIKRKGRVISMKKYKIGYTAGVYDMFHIGHLNLLKRAKEQCDYLIVGVTTDELSFKNKNKHPIIPYEERKSIVEAIKYVDKVIPQEDGNKLLAYQKEKFDVIFVGDDWKGTETWDNYEKEFKKLGVDVVYFPYTKETSSTILREKLIKRE